MSVDRDRRPRRRPPRAHKPSKWWGGYWVKKKGSSFDTGWPEYIYIYTRDESVYISLGYIGHIRFGLTSTTSFPIANLIHIYWLYLERPSHKSRYTTSHSIEIDSSWFLIEFHLLLNVYPSILLLRQISRCSFISGDWYWLIRRWHCSFSDRYREKEAPPLLFHLKDDIKPPKNNPGQQTNIRAVGGGAPSSFGWPSRVVSIDPVSLIAAPCLLLFFFLFLLLLLLFLRFFFRFGLIFSRQPNAPILLPLRPALSISSEALEHVSWKFPLLYYYFFLSSFSPLVAPFFRSRRPFCSRNHGQKGWSISCAVCLVYRSII